MTIVCFLFHIYCELCELVRYCGKPDIFHEIKDFGKSSQLNSGRHEKESKGNGHCLTAWVLENNNMDYLKVNHDGKTPICPNNNKELTWERGSCK